MDLNTIWFILVTILFIGFFFLEGFDYGVGILMPFLSKEDNERRAVINTIGPHWDGNEVWMITAGGALFAAFPHVYATLFSGFYLALVLMLAALILRGLAFEYRSLRDDPVWRNRWDWAIFTGSLVPALLWGVTVGNLMRGFAIDADMNYWGGLFPLLNTYSLLAGFVFVALFTAHGANFLALKLEGDLAERAKKFGFQAWIVATVLAVLFLIWTFFETNIMAQGLIPALLAAVALLLAGWYAKSGKDGLAFIMTSLTIVFTTIMVFAGLFPRILISSIDAAYTLNIYNASASPYSLKVMTIVAAIFVPVVLVYQIWTYKVFSGRIKADPETLIY
ncbi:MAG: cytochrome d ubiquinol oxidase subunit II [Anaerolineae bacterium]|jgi:cytochrome d ubiquinol oxidase subunit II|nr:cytochrome d ubiquinol oxidase subunit II [Anaerolineae bacterium]MBT3713555.1 cytochrome d ubiquinol oxidase subunit II [Anaerolineae bacterium]MBT4309028.1 cytochrome d ubiquinol oxidase subunit II [Anaerolineae bacterium]MBT4458917.1 cytochrome d ubiquinol oxidase subunit II [Anaerolineae bacterium]MBT4841698.1 cytochrome d ubiquinol oxidase subunit II [Anaerolineae bacterium]